MRWVALFALGACVLMSGCRSVMVQSRPSGAQIYIDGKDTGLITPAVLYPRDYLRGKHKLVLEKEGYMPATAGFNIKNSPPAVVLSIIPVTAIVALPINIFKYRWRKFARPMYPISLTTLAAHQEMLDAKKDIATQRRLQEIQSCTFFGLLIEGKFTQEAKAKLGAPAKERPYDENIMSTYESTKAFAPFHQMMVEHSPADGTITSLRFYGFYDSDEKATKYLKALHLTLGEDYEFKNLQDVFFIQKDANARVYRIILTKFKPKKDQNIIVIDNNRLKVYETKARANQTLLVLDVLGYSYKVDDATIEATGQGIRGELKPIDKKQEELKESIKAGKKL